MSYYHTCLLCGANLDPGERCDCRPALEAEARRLLSQLSDSEIAEIMEEAEAAFNCGANSPECGNLQQKGLPGVTTTEQANGPE